MQDPKRWSELSSGALPEESAILRAGAAERMPNELRNQVWSAVALAAAGGAAVTALGAASGAAQGSIATVETASTAGVVGKGLALVSSSVIKGMIAIAVLGGAGVGAMHLRSSANPHASAHHSPTLHAAEVRGVASSRPPELTHDVAALEMNSTSSAAVSAASAPTSATAIVPPAAASSKSQSTQLARRAEPEDAGAHAGDASTASLASSRLREESAAVLAIRRTLLAGNAREALALLARAREEFPHGALAEEREALSVRALMAAGNKDAARQRGEAFLRRFPRSPQAGDVRRLLGSE